ncbi:MAG: hypothetical protein SGI77_10450 [Pirellulaceae bacterium]|nr:hypothetical protein [Pirellulaceae bacterium]
MMMYQVFWSLMLAVAFLLIPGLAEYVGLLYVALVFRKHLF